MILATLIARCGLGALLVTACVNAAGRPIVAIVERGVVVTVATRAGVSYQHPATVSEEDVRSALVNTGYLLGADSERIAPDIARAFTSLHPNERVRVERTYTEIELFVVNHRLVVEVHSDNRYQGERSYPLTAIPTVAASEASAAPQGAPSIRPTAEAPDGQLPSKAGEARSAPSNGGEPTSPTVATATMMRGDADSAGRVRPSGIQRTMTTSLPRIWTFAVGVSEHKAAGVVLKYAADDARALDAFFASPKGGSVPDSRRTLLVNSKATRDAILSGLRALANLMSADDLLVLHLAMHGLADPGGELYFLAHDSEPNHLIGTGLPQRDIRYALTLSRTKRIVIFVDACHAGAFGSAPTSRGLEIHEVNRLLAGLADTKPGTAVLTASTATEASNEDAKWGGGHGVFTHYLLLGLKGQADGDGDGLVSIRELFEFSYAHVTQETRSKQHPELKGDFDDHLPLAIVPSANP